MSAARYLEEVRRLLDYIETSQMPVIHEVARAAFDVIVRGGVIHVFGAGHAHMVAEEAFARAGGLVPTVALLDPGFMVYGGFLKNSALERLPGYGRLVFEHYDTRPGEIVVVHSQSGRNAAPVDVALAAREKGLKVVAITSLAHSKAVESGHPSGLKLYQVADWVIDNGCPHGDAILEFGQGRPRVAPLSTVAGVVIWNMIVAEVAALLAGAASAGPDGTDRQPSSFFPFWTSANVEGGAEANRRYVEAYRGRWRNLI